MKILILVMFLLMSCSVFKKNKTQSFSDQIKKEVNLGENLTASFLSENKILNNKSVQLYINHLGAGIVDIFGRSEIKYHFAILESNEIKAYAIPGGHVLVDKGLLKLVQNEAELVGLLIHEISHINRRHLLKKLGEGYKSEKNVAILTKKGSEILKEQKLTTQAILRADYDAIKYMSLLGYDPKNYQSLIVRLKLKDAVTRNEKIQSYITKLKIPKGLATKKERFWNYAKSL